MAEPKSKYTPVAQNYLSITRSLFTKYANRPSNTITRDKVAQLLNETYGALGRKGYHPSEEDINVWMKLCDTNSDGHVEEAEYEYFVVRALERSGVQVNAWCWIKVTIFCDIALSLLIFLNNQLIGSVFITEFMTILLMWTLHSIYINETSMKHQKTIIFKGPHRLNWARSWSFSTWHRVSTSPMIIALPLNSINTSLFARSILPTSSALLFTATKGNVIEFNGFGPMALFFAKSLLSFCCWFSSL